MKQVQDEMRARMGDKRKIRDLGNHMKNEEEKWYIATFAIKYTGL